MEPSEPFDTRPADPGPLASGPIDSGLGLSVPLEDLIETYPPVAESVPLARRALARLAAACGAAAEQIDAIRLAVSEAMTTAVLAGQETEAAIRVRAGVCEGGLAVLIDDDRSQMLPLARDRDLGAGVALALIAHATDELAIAKRATGGTELRMRFGLGGLGLSPRT